MSYFPKKIFVLFIAFTVVFNISVSANPKSGQPLDSIKIKKQETTRTFYNPDGNITSVKVYNSNDSLESFTLNKYNKKGLLSESVGYFANGKQKSKNKIFYSKNDSFKIYEENVAYSESGGITSSSSNIYNEKGMLTRVVNCRFEFTTDDKIQCDTSDLSMKKSSDGLSSQTLNYYKDFGIKKQLKVITTKDTNRHLEETSTFYNDTLSGKNTIEYDSTGMIIKTSSYGADGKLLYYTDYSENKAGNIFVSTSYNQFKTVTDKTIIIKDKHKNPIKIISYNENEKLTFKEEYKYKYTKKDKYSEVELVKYY